MKGGGIVVLYDALDLNWGARMFEVQVTGDPFWMELGSPSGCTGDIALPPIRIIETTPIVRIGTSCRTYAPALPATSRSTCGRYPEIWRPTPAQLQIAGGLRRRPVTGCCPVADMFFEKPTKEARFFPSLDAPRLSAVAESHINDTRARRRYGRERGTKLCR